MSPDANQPTILVLDDEKNIRKSIEIALEAEGYCVLQAHDTAAALRTPRSGSRESRSSACVARGVLTPPSSAAARARSSASRSALAPSAQVARASAPSKS